MEQSSSRFGAALPLILLAVAGLAVWYFVIREPPQQKVDKLLEEALSSINTFEFNKAQGLLKQAIAIEPENALLRHRLAMIHLKQNELAQARQAFEDAAALYEGKDNVLQSDEYFELAQLDFREKRYSEAEQHLMQAIRAYPTLPLFHTRLIDMQLSVLKKPAAADTSTKRFILVCGRTTENLLKQPMYIGSAILLGVPSA